MSGLRIHGQLPAHPGSSVPPGAVPPAHAAPPSRRPSPNCPCAMRCTAHKHSDSSSLRFDEFRCRKIGKPAGGSRSDTFGRLPLHTDRSATLFSGPIRALSWDGSARTRQGVVEPHYEAIPTRLQPNLWVACAAHARSTASSDRKGIYIMNLGNLRCFAAALSGRRQPQVCLGGAASHQITQHLPHRLTLARPHERRFRCLRWHPAEGDMLVR